MIEVSYIAILAAGIANVILGFIWYHPKVFGTTWMGMVAMSPEKMQEGKRKMPLMTFLAFLSSLVVAYVLQYLGIALGIYDWVGAVFELALWTWIGFVAPPMLGMVLWEGKPIKYYAIVAGYWLVALIIMSLVLLYLA